MSASRTETKGFREFVGLFGLKRDKVAERYRKMQNEECRNFQTSPNFVRMIMLRRTRWAVGVACVAEMRNAYKILVGKLQDKKPLGRPMRE
jgi:hypothetical protein